MKKIMSGVIALFLFTSSYFIYQSLTIQKQIDQKVDQLLDENTSDTKNTENPALDTEQIDYGTALSRVETIDDLINLFRYDLAEADYTAYGYKAFDLYKEIGAETFIVTLAAREDITLQEEIVKMIIDELKLVWKMDSSLDLQTYIDRLVTFINETDPTGNELRLAYDLRWQLEDLKNGKLED